MFSLSQSNRGFRPIYLSLMVLPALLLLVATLSAAVQTPAVDNPAVWLQAPDGPIAVGDEITVTVRIDDIVNLYGIQFTLDFEPSTLTAIDQDPVLADVQIAPGDCPATDFVVKNKADNVAGKLEYAVTQISPTPPVNGNCTVAHIRFQARRATSTQLEMTNLILADPEGKPIEASSSVLEMDIGGSHRVFLPAVIR